MTGACLELENLQRQHVMNDVTHEYSATAIDAGLAYTGRISYLGYGFVCRAKSRGADQDFGAGLPLDELLKMDRQNVGHGLNCVDITAVLEANG